MSWGNITDLEAWLTSISIWHCVSLIFNFSLISTMEIGINLNIHILFVGVEISNIWDPLFITRLPPAESANCLRLESKSFEYYKSKYFLLWLKTFWTGKDMSYMRSTYNLNITQVDMFSAVQTTTSYLSYKLLVPEGGTGVLGVFANVHFRILYYSAAPGERNDCIQMLCLVSIRQNVNWRYKSDGFKKENVHKNLGTGYRDCGCITTYLTHPPQSYFPTKYKEKKNTKLKRKLILKPNEK